jgi:hypothetical protein
MVAQKNDYPNLKMVIPHRYRHHLREVMVSVEPARPVLQSD